MNHRTQHALRRSGYLGLLVLLAGIIFLVLAPSADAAASRPCAASPSVATITLAAVNLAPGQDKGPVGTPSSVTVTYNCKDVFLDAGVYSDDFSLLAGNLAPFDPNANAPSGGIMFTTNVPGIDVLLTAVQQQASGGSNGPSGLPGWKMGEIDCIQVANDAQCNPGSVQVTFTAQLFKTGKVTPGAVSSIRLLQYFNQDYYCLFYWGDTCYLHVQADPSPAFGTLMLNAVNVGVSACNVTDQTVRLPTVYTLDFKGARRTAGPKSFQVQLTCPAGSNVSMTLAAGISIGLDGIGVTGSQTGAGAATGVGVQILHDGNPINFGTAIAIPERGMPTFQARYYQTDSQITGGKVKATATYTLTYQ